jgi:hypothetical protein
MIEPNIDIVIDCHDLEAQLDFWSAALEYHKIGIKDNYGLLVPHERAYPPVVLQRVPEPKTAKTRVHFDLRVDDVETRASELEALGARRIDVGQPTDAGFIPMADPEGNEFWCVQERHLTGDPGDRSARGSGCPDHRDHRLRQRTPGQPRHPGRSAGRSVPHHGQHMLLTRVRRWHDERTPLRAYPSHDGAIMLADPALGGNAPCEPPTTPDTYHARDEATPHDHSPTEDK